MKDGLKEVKELAKDAKEEAEKIVNYAASVIRCLVFGKW